MLTHDDQQAARMPATRRSSADLGARADRAHDTATRVILDSGAIEAPTLMLTGLGLGRRHRTQLRCFAGIAARRKRLVTLPGFFHSVFHERDARCRSRRRELCASRSRAASEAPYAPADLTRADRHGPRRRARAAVAAAVAALAARLAFALQGSSCARWAGSAPASGSARPRLRLGATLDYVYENRPRGTTPLGRLIDRFYLARSAGAGSARAACTCSSRCGRAAHAAAATCRCASSTRGRPRPLRARVDPRGPGRARVPVEAHLRDFDPANVAAAERLASELGVAGATFARATRSTARRSRRSTPRPTLGVVLGLYELFADNDGSASPCAASPRRSRRVGSWSTRTSPGTRSSSSSRAC
jgi:hypothetical protein